MKDWAQIVILAVAVLFSGCASHHAEKEQEMKARHEECERQRLDIMQRALNMCAQRQSELTLTAEEVEAAESGKSASHMKAALQKASSVLRTEANTLREHCALPRSDQPHGCMMEGRPMCGCDDRHMHEEAH